MPKHLDIDFVSDVACPWCGIGLHSLEEALRRTADVVQAEVRFQPFELNPAMQPGGVNHDDYLGSRLGMSRQQLLAGNQMLRDRATALGFTIDFNPHSRIYNTFDAHRLLYWAGTQGLQRELKHALLKANFTDNRNVSDQQVLAEVAASVGLDAESAREVLASDRYARDVREAEQLWMSRGISGVPGIVVNGKWLISGGQPPEIFEQALRSIAAELA